MREPRRPIRKVLWHFAQYLILGNNSASPLIIDRRLERISPGCQSIALNNIAFIQPCQASIDHPSPTPCIYEARVAGLWAY